jgi:hypothetical protein
MHNATLTTTAAHTIPPITCATCHHKTSRHNYRWQDGKGYEICTHCQQPLTEATT